MPLNVLPGLTGHPLEGFSFAAAVFNTVSFSTMLSGVQTSAGVPPQLALINPTGKCNCCCSIRPKKYQAALNFFMSSGLHTTQCAFNSSYGYKAVVIGI